MAPPNSFWTNMYSYAFQMACIPHINWVVNEELIWLAPIRTNQKSSLYDVRRTMASKKCSGQPHPWVQSPTNSWPLAFMWMAEIIRPRFEVILAKKAVGQFMADFFSMVNRKSIFWRKWTTVPSQHIHATWLRSIFELLRTFSLGAPSEESGQNNFRAKRMSAWDSICFSLTEGLFTLLEDGQPLSGLSKCGQCQTAFLW